MLECRQSLALVKYLRRNTGLIRSYRKMIKILFICHGRILKSSGKACKINGFTEGKDVLLHHYYTIWGRALI